MNLKAAWLATATAAAFLLLAACGGDGGESHLDGASDSSQSQAPSGSAAGSGIGPSSSGNGSSSNNCSGSRTNAQYIAIDLHSSGYPGTIGWGIGGGEQVGQGYSFS